MIDIEKVLSNMPDFPGVYQMRDVSGKIIYVGKARNLKKRVRSYFNEPEKLTNKTRSLVENISSIDYVIVDSEMEALLLECTLIKQLKPKYNILLKDDKGYPYIRINKNDLYPTVQLARRYKADGAVYFGPYVGASIAREVVDIINDIFPLRSCEKELDGTKKGKVCLRYHLGKCLAPCTGSDKQEYDNIIKDVLEFLKGGHIQIIEIMKQKMNEASLMLDFERAADLRDKINRIERVMGGQKVELTEKINMDVIAAALDGDIGYACVQMFFIRRGIMIGSKQYEMIATIDDTVESIISAFIINHYADSNIVPPNIITSCKLENAEVLENYLREIRGGAVNISSVSRGNKRKLAEMAEKNALDRMKKSSMHEKQEREKLDSALSELADTIGLAKQPYRIEAFDISNIQGIDSVASMIVFENGLPANAEYRRFKIKTVEGPNDFASMNEVVTRRFRRAKENDQAFSKLPDLILIDGGKGQLGASLEALGDLGVRIPAIGLAKRLEEIIMPDGDSILLSQNSDALRLLQRVRDEAHRFAITYHRSLRTQRGVKSILTNIPGIGETRRKNLYRAFSSVERISKASMEELQEVKGMNAAAAKAVFDHFANLKKSSS